MNAVSDPDKCPVCLHPESWSVWQGKEAVMGTCHRALCGHGTRPIDGSRILAPKKREARHYTRPIRPLTDAQHDLLLSKFGLYDVVDGYNEQDDRFILGVYGPVGYNRRGCIAYSLSGAKPKSLTYKEKLDEPFVHYAGRGDSFVIVEDWFSAEKVAAAGGTGVAIMGTNLTQAMVSEVAVAGRPTYIALDRDAYAKTIGYVAKYREQFPRGLYAWALRQDLKYESTERIKRALDGEADFSSDDKRPERV